MRDSAQLRSSSEPVLGDHGGAAAAGLAAEPAHAGVPAGEPAGTRDAEATPSLARMVRQLAVHDLMVLGYLGLVTLVAAVLPPSPGQAASFQRFGLSFLGVLSVVVSIRSGLLRHGVVAPLLYRLAIYGGVQFSYFLLADLLPVVNTRTLDRELLDLDLMLFGVEPALWMDVLVTPFTSEWFSFFYFGYFFVLAAHVVPILLFAKNRQILGEFALGAISVFCIGHTVYMLVPGYGPYRAYAHLFLHEFSSGAWHDLVMAAVRSGGAMMDIFPSLHTAAPTFITLFSFRHRHRLPFRYSWPLSAFCTVNIIFATMFLRWHYLVDVVAGVLLATVGLEASILATRWEEARRTRQRLMPAWPEYAPGGSTPQHQR